MNQASIESYRTIKYWSFNDSRAIKIFIKIINKIALDNQPFTIISIQGFIDMLVTLEPCYLIPSTKYFTDTKLLQSYESLKLKIQTEISEASFL